MFLSTSSPLAPLGVGVSVTAPLPERLPGLMKGFHDYSLLSGTVFLVVYRRGISPFTRVQLRCDPIPRLRLKGRNQGGAIDHPLLFLEA